MSTQKQNLARKLISRQEIKDGVSIFNSKGWKLRKSEIAQRVKNKELTTKQNIG